MMSKFFSETVVATTLVIILIWFINPFGFLMTTTFHMTLLGLIVALFAIFAMFLWRETVEDEREQLIRFIATRFAYTTVGSVLLIGTILQALSHAIDPWIPLALTSMVIAKIIGRWYAKERY